MIQQQEQARKYQQDMLDSRKPFVPTQTTTISEKKPIDNDVISPGMGNGMSISTVTGDMNKVNQSTVDDVTTRL